MENLKELVERFRTENGRYPASLDFDNIKYLPSSRTIQRNFGGIAKFKENIGLPIEFHDFRVGEGRSKKALKSMIKSNKQESELYDYLVDEFGIRNVHRESPYEKDSKIRTDFMLYHSELTNDVISIDIFYPNSIYSLVGCINAKINKIDFSKLGYPVFLVNMNRQLDSVIEGKMNKKKIQLPKNVQVISKKQLLNLLKELKNE